LHLDFLFVFSASDFRFELAGPDSPNAGFDGRCASFTLDRYLEFGDAIDAMLLLWRALKSWKRTLQSRPLLPSFFELPFKTGNDSDAADDGLIEHSVWKHDIVVPFQPYVHSPANICTPAAPIDLGYASFLIHAEEFIFELDDAPLDIAQRIKRKMTLSSVVMMFEEAIRKRYHSLPRVLPSWLQSENSESKLYEPISIGVAANAQKTDDEPPPPPADLNENVDIPMVPSPLLRSASQPNPNIPPLPLDEPDAALQLQKTHTSDLSGLATANHLASLHRQWLNILTMNPSIRASDDSDHAAESVPSSQSKDAVAQPLKRAKTASVSFQSDSASGSDIEFPTHETSEFEVHAAQQRLDAIQAAHDRQAESARQQQLRKFQSEMKHVLRLECNDFRFGLTLKPEWLEPQAISNLLRESDPDSFADSVRDGRTSDNQVRLELFREIWARYFLLSSSETKLSLRDHPIPMLLSRSFSLRGSVLAAQMRPPDARFLLLKQLNITPTLSVIVDRGEHLQPLLKVYHQLQLDATDARISYSPSYEQALESGSQALGRIGTSPEVALGGKLDWWDNARYRFHGKLQINLNRSIIRLVSGPSPYATDHFALEFEKLQLSFATGSFKMVASDACGFIRSDEDLLIESQEYHRKKDLVAHFDSIDDGLDGVPSFSTNDFVSFGDLPFADRNTQQTPVASVPNVVLVLKFEWILESSSLSQILPLQKLHDLHHFIWTKKAFQVWLCHIFYFLLFFAHTFFHFLSPCNRMSIWISIARFALAHFESICRLLLCHRLQRYTKLSLSHLAPRFPCKFNR
jgi:hypothetical protein